MNKLVTASALATLGLAGMAQATLTAWQTEVGLGATASSTVFATTSTPVKHDVGTLSGAQSFEFIVNANLGGASSALLGDRTSGTGNEQALKFEQYNNTGNLGLSAFGVADWNSGVAAPTGVDTHIVFSTDGVTGTNLYLNGALVGTTTTVLDISGLTGLGAVDRGASFQDVMDGDILGFASYDSELTSGEILDHYNAFNAAAVPEPTSTMFIGLGAVCLLFRKRR
ncbi:PEP-CTERM protein-sorting domain-containing protein [Rubritalea squalenifaciens DSM 18772]|uniref:PEP-CTERM protein-sorting domain-containing protein n=1 Tax=Rubritalea squalenifaciens DSM 18772 TaxID=1123071 RepID=A0A1M6PM55_9BACT|nr:LamG-like jellyroll fold domain-containing protein [Rubritalea squalenifaciens]SHK09025.1 PEP-CTERM protein-sorting domain-containing protein [Rubritalea squalenifaciens DSM 18772]